MKNKVLQKILTYIGVALIGALVGAGALVGVSSCASNHEAKADTNEITTQFNKKQRRITLTSDYFNKDVLLYFVAKNYYNNGNGTFYNGDHIGIDTSSRFPVTTSGDQYVSQAVISILDGSNVNQTHLTFTGQLYQGVSTLTRVYLDGSGVVNDLYRVYNTTPPSGVFNRDYSAFLVKRLGVANDIYNFMACVNTYFNILEVTGEHFDFIDRFNYNAWYNRTGDYTTSSITTPYAYQAVLPAIDSNFGTYYYATYKVPSFYVKGFVFDTIEMHYATGNTLSFEWDNEVIINDLTPETANSYMYYRAMKFTNSITNYSIIVNRRDSLYMSSLNGTLVKQDTTWLNNDYKNIQFLNDLSENDRTFFEASRNNVDIGSGFYVGSNVDIGLGNAFSLLGLAFSSLTSLFSIQVLPGISLGLLLFLPLIAGIIIAVIWVVKR